MAETLTPATRDAVLARLGFADRPPVDRSGLDAVYLAWCRTVPFDNLVKLVDLRTGTAPFRNDLPEDFFALFLAHGAGGTCWPSSRALAALLRSLGFELTLGSAAMGDELFGPVHSHGTIIATVGDEQLWVDTSMQTDLPVPLVPGAATALDHPLRPVRVEPVGDAWRVHWTTGTNPGELGCLLLDPDVTGAHYSARYEWSREMSPFNTLVMSTRP
ncbi:MAG: arylamine N-acetyltransferase, partial [Acidimicrobiia bacterium]